MKRLEYFYLDQSSVEGKYLIRINFDLMPKMYTCGSYNLLAARVLGLSYANYLRFCRDVLGAELIGKYSAYPLAHLPNNLKTKQFIRMLNSRMGLIMWEREHPNWREHQQFLEERKKEKDNVLDKRDIG